MGEIEKTISTESKFLNSTAVQKVMIAFTSSTIRGIVDYANEKGISKEDIVSLLEVKGQYYLIYYK